MNSACQCGPCRRTYYHALDADPWNYCHMDTTAGVTEMGRPLITGPFHGDLWLTPTTC
jgi:hypothetical protein